MLTSAACGEAEASQSADAVIIDIATQEPEDLTEVLDTIYTNVAMSDLSDSDDQELVDLFHLVPEAVDQYAIRYSSGRYGVADVAIIKPIEGHTEDVTSSLEARRNDRIAEFENYDIHDSLRIATEADIFTRGNYVIMLMLSDAEKEAAYNIIVERIPG